MTHVVFPGLSNGSRGPTRSSVSGSLSSRPGGRGC